MTYKEKLKAFEEGRLNETEAKEIENDIDKFEALYEFFGESQSPVELKEENPINFTNEINKLINKKIGNTVIKTVLTILLFVFLFIFGLSTSLIAQKFNSPDMAEYILNGIYALVFIPTVITMMYRMFVKKDKASAIILLVWNIVPTILTFIISSIIGDAFAVFLPAYYGFSTIPSAVGSLFKGTFAENIGSVFGIGGMLISVILSVIALILEKKKINYKTVSKKATTVLLSVFIIFDIALISISTTNQINKGYFPDSKICSEKTAENLKECSSAVFTSDILGMTTENADRLYKDNGFTSLYEVDMSYNALIKKSNNILRVETTDKDGKIYSASYSSAYRCRYLYISIENIEKIEKEYMGKTEKETMEYFASVNFFPNYVNYYYNDDGVKIAEYGYNIDIPADEYHFRYMTGLTITFENGIMTHVVDIS